MRIIQSFWSKPLISKPREKRDLRHFVLSWSLSCLQLRKFYDDVVLYTDSIGKELLIDVMQLPYSNVVCALNELENYDPSLWAIGKLYTYKLQKEPFLHTDGDIFIWQRFADTVYTNDLTILHDESNPSTQFYYQKGLKEVMDHCDYIPEWMVERPPVAVNAGIIGGVDVEFFQKYTALAFDFVTKNRSSLAKYKIESINALFEQFLFRTLAENDQKSVNFYLDENADLYSMAARPPHGVIHARSDKRRVHPFMDDLTMEYVRTHYYEYFVRFHQNMNVLANI